MENIKEMGIKGQVIRGQVYFLNIFFGFCLDFVKKNPNTYTTMLKNGTNVGCLQVVVTLGDFLRAASFYN